MEDLAPIVVQARSGDLEAYSILVRNFQDVAVGYAYSVLGDFHLAEDAAQEAFVEAYRVIADLRHPQAFRSGCATSSSSTAIGCSGAGASSRYSPSRLR